MRTRWSRFHSSGLSLCRKVDRAVARLDHPERGTFASLTNALEFQFEQGADPETVRHLLHALISFARSAALSPEQLGLAEDPDDVFARLSPKLRRAGRTKP
ncbi:MAG: hypothetical protein HY816_07410 [Candidatus Wallbacteria bacterium]|nr:hypothetical protein [Candidatus Wallbacteria bacterium]